MRVEGSAIHNAILPQKNFFPVARNSVKVSLESTDALSTEVPSLRARGSIVD